MACFKWMYSPCVDCRTQVKYAAYKPLDWAALFVPAVGWLRTYRWRSDDLLVSQNAAQKLSNFEGIAIRGVA